MERSTSAQCATEALIRRRTAELENRVRPFFNDTTIEQAVLHQLTRSLDLPPLNSLAMEEFISDPRLCSKEVRQEVILRRNAPSLTESEYLRLLELHDENKHNKELDNRPICTICQDTIEKPVAPSSEERTDDIAIKLFTAKVLEFSGCIELKPCDVVPHVFHLGCIREYFFHDQHTETVKCPNCCNVVYNGQGGYQKWDWSFVMDSQTGEYIESFEPSMDGYLDEEDSDYAHLITSSDDEGYETNGETWINETGPDEEMDTSHELEDKAETSGPEPDAEQSYQANLHQGSCGTQSYEPYEPYEYDADDDTDESDETIYEVSRVDLPAVDLRRPLLIGEEPVLSGPFPRTVEELVAEPEEGPPGGPMRLEEFNAMLANSRNIQQDRTPWGRAKLTEKLKEQVVQQLHLLVHGMLGDYLRPVLRKLVDEWYQKKKGPNGLLEFHYDNFYYLDLGLGQHALWRFLCPEWARRADEDTEGEESCFEPCWDITD
ncbi:hypothetical protein E2P81_ATG04326 [Venturia nashicola]|uniref:Uncharacterized protein n=1 Tax=Venturia nashicola TaxID=86259 RepID=A0A4Z1PQQ9_9PEZI|nr:hypothetical protein E6O75_ATG04427 [Venturia nashicola]TLD37514.1 hypothetical protein E2P81_ATG04326 [Venturia nashicola]